MHRITRCKRTNPMPWHVLSAVLRAERGQASAIVRRRRPVVLAADTTLRWTVAGLVMALAVIATSITMGLVASP